MITPTERQLRELFAADADAAPRGSDLAAGALRKVRHRRRVRTAGAAGLIATVVVVGGLAATWSPAGPGDPSGAVTDTPAPTGVGVLGGATGDCTGYSPARFAERLTEPGFFALDGTVTAIEPGPDLGPEEMTQFTTVTFAVRTWYQGGSGETADVFLYPPALGDIATYGMGTRLLVSGVLAETEGVSNVLTETEDEGFFGFTCGFTRYYDEQTAAEWASATD